MTGKITGELRAYGDNIASGKALPSAGSAFTPAFTNAGILSDTELVLKADTAISITSGKSLSFELHDCATESGTYLKAADIVSFSGSSSIASGTELVRFVPNSVTKTFMKIKITDTEDLSSAKISIYPVKKG